ncbi:MAG: amino acid synthesis family protein [Gammaproteobacteria bacterium]|nr:amino acid synthesis family protein [Gammaproteobacteria bacterium]
MSLTVRRKQTILEEVLHEGGPVAAHPTLIAATAAVVVNPFAGRYVEAIEYFMDELKPLGMEMSRTLIETLGNDAARIDGFGKGAIVGAAGELEHGALWHVPGGYAMRELLGDSKAIVPSTKKVGPVGTRLDIPITHINASYVRSHFNSFEVYVPGAPAADEMVLVLVMSCGPRVHERVGGLKAGEIKGEDGLR